MAWLIIVTGRPAAGKSTLATWLGRQLSFPVISKDNIKEVLFEQLGWRDREWSKMLGRASVELMYHFAQTQLEADQSVVLENAFHPDLASVQLQRLLDQHESMAIQLICNTNNNVLFERFKQRAKLGERYAGHVDAQSLDELKQNLAKERPISLEIKSHVIYVDTTDFATLKYEIIFERIKTIMNNTNNLLPSQG
ncbi:MAG: AAA family ATPase [Candidatus Promineifilaceae bacterium]